MTRNLGSPDVEPCDRIIQDILKAIIAETEFTSNPHDIKHWQLPLHGIISPAVKIAMELILLCFDFDVQILVSSVLDKLLLHVSSSADTTHSIGIERLLVPLIPRIRELLLRRGQAMTCEPYRQFTAKALKDYVNVVLGTPPPESITHAEIEAIGCGCGHCRLLKSFFIGTETVIKIQEKPSVKKHLEQQLEATSGWGVEWKTINWTSPETLQVTKPASLVAPIRWAERQERGLKFMQSVGTAVELSKILGSDYTFVAIALGFRTPLTVNHQEGN